MELMPRPEAVLQSASPLARHDGDASLHGSPAEARNAMTNRQGDGKAQEGLACSWLAIEDAETVRWDEALDKPIGRRKGHKSGQETGTGYGAGNRPTGPR